MADRAPVAVAVDVPDAEAARRLAEQVAPSVTTVKLGLELCFALGPQAAAEAVEGLDVDLFLDLKLHDIPNTVAGAVRSLRRLEPRWLTVHASGGPAMIAAAAAAAPEIGIVGVTVLTSLGEDDVRAVGWGGDPREAVLRLARLAVDAGAGALVCSPAEVAAVRAAVGPGVTLITPGVRPRGSDPGDQRRVATPEQALADGADLLVIGRPITGADDPAAAAGDLAAGLGSTSASAPVA